MNFVLDSFQTAAIEAIDRGESVLVAAPTGAGKTVVAEHAIRRALLDGEKAFYTTPIKALSNQKYHDLVAEHGEARIGLLTGDRSVNGDAPVVVMTTEVLRNMLYAGSPTLDGLRWVVLDEVHYLRDRARGAVWEEVIIHAPNRVRLVALSATVSNADEFADWFRSVRGPTTLIESDHRPVELTHYEMIDVGRRQPPLLMPLFVDGVANSDGPRYNRRRDHGRRRGKQHHNRSKNEPRPPRRTTVVGELAHLDLLPAIYFLFSRAGCDDAARLVGRADLGLTSPADRRRTTEIAGRHVDILTPEEKAVLGWDDFSYSLLNGIASHHAGLVPAYKELVEELFLEGLLRVVFATETLALGINMPARTVVIERLTKFTGETHEVLTPIEYTQLTGRAGRRGLDTSGTAIVLWSPWVTFDDLADLASSTEYPLVSAFRPSYNMAANLAARHDRAEAHRLLRLSFAQFQADGSVTSLERHATELAAEVERLVDEATCEHGDVAAAMVDRNRDAKQRLGQTRGAVSRLRPGSVIHAPGGYPVAVVSVAHRRNGAIRIRAVDRRGHDERFEPADFDFVPVALTEVSLPEPFDPANVRFRSAVAKDLRRCQIDDLEPSPFNGAGAVASCPKARLHFDAHEALPRARKRLRRYERRLAERTDGIDRRFDDLCTLLAQRGCMQGWALTEKGEQLRGVFHELDLLVVEALNAGVFDNLDAASLAALTSCITYQSRSDERSPRARVASSELRHRIDQLDDLAVDLAADESELGISITRRPDEGFVSIAYQWADGAGLDTLVDEDLTGGDFVRQMKQLLDVLRQLGVVAPNPITATVARQAADALDRGVVAVETS